MPRLMLLSFTEPTDMPVSHTPVMPDMPMELTHMLTMERDLLKLSQRLMLTMDTTDMPDLMPMVTDHTDTQLMVTTERDLLMLSQRLMLMLTMVSMDTHMLQERKERLKKRAEAKAAGKEDSPTKKKAVVHHGVNTIT